MADRFWPGTNPVGERVLLDMTPDEQPREVIGVVRDYRANPFEEHSRPAMFVLYRQQPPHTRWPLGAVMRSRMNFVVRTAGDPAALAGPIRASMAELDREQPVPDVQPLEEDLHIVLAPARYMTVVSGLFATIATLLAAVGLYGVMSHSVNQRIREIGIRMAMGADPADVVRLIMRQVALLAAAGLTVGLVAALGLTRVMSNVASSVLFGVTSLDAVTYIAVSLLMASIALLAGWIPARRAIRVAPTVALRCE